MKNKKSLFLPLALLLLLAPASAHAACPWSLFTFLFGCSQGFKGVSENYYNTYRSCQYADDRYVCDTSPRPRLSDSMFTQAQYSMRDDGYNWGDSSGECTTYRNGCQDCPGPQHAMDFKSPSGRNIMLRNPGQNRLQPSIIAVLKQLADSRDKDISVTSGYRSCDYQRTRGVGVSRSQHLMGRAADFHFVGAGPTHGALAQYARKTLQQMGQSGGTGTYCSAVAHVDTGSSREWNWCGRR